jgi:hypothetical protein
MAVLVDVRPSIVAVSSDSGFLHLIQALLDNLGLPVRTSSESVRRDGSPEANRFAV